MIKDWVPLTVFGLFMLVLFYFSSPNRAYFAAVATCDTKQGYVAVRTVKNEIACIPGFYPEVK